MVSTAESPQDMVFTAESPQIGQKTSTVVVLKVVQEQRVLSSFSGIPMEQIINNNARLPFFYNHFIITSVRTKYLVRSALISGEIKEKSERFHAF